MSDTETTESYSDWTAQELKDEAKARQLAYSGLNKEALVQLLETDDEEEEPEETDDEVTEDDDSEEVEYEHAFGTCVPLAPCPHVKGASEEVEEEEDEETDEESDEDE